MKNTSYHLSLFIIVIICIQQQRCNHEGLYIPVSDYTWSVKLQPVAVSRTLNYHPCIMNVGNTKPRLPSDDRDKPEGRSYVPSTSESNTQKRIQKLEADYNSIVALLKKEREAHENEKSKWRKEEVKLLKDIEELKELVKNQTGPFLEGTPQLILDQHNSSDSAKSQSKYLQQVATRIRYSKTKQLQQLEKMRSLQQMIYTMVAQAKHKGVDYRRAVPASMDSPSVSSQTGLSASSNLTFSLMSAAPPDRLTRGYNERHMTSNTAANIDKSTVTPNTLVGATGTRFDRHGPVERSDHEYANADEYLLRDMAAPQTLITETPNRLSEYTSHTGTVKKSTKPPVPMPRTTRSLKFTALPSVAVAESMQSIADSYEIVDKVPDMASAIPSHITYINRPQHPLGIISELSASSESSGLSVALSNINTNQPTRLSQNVTVAAPVSKQASGVQSSYTSNQVCDVCHHGFPRLTRRQYLDHCLDCAERAAAEEERTVAVGTQETNVADLRTCPLCQKAFNSDIPQTDYENHVQSHFMEDEARTTGWENVSAS